MMIDKFIVNWAPEMLKGNHSGKEGDVWALGILLFVFLFGESRGETPVDEVENSCIAFTQRNTISQEGQGFDF